MVLHQHYNASVVVYMRVHTHTHTRARAHAHTRALSRVNIRVGNSLCSAACGALHWVLCEEGGGMVGLVTIFEVHQNFRVRARAPEVGSPDYTISTMVLL